MKSTCILRLFPEGIFTFAVAGDHCSRPNVQNGGHNTLWSQYRVDYFIKKFAIGRNLRTNLTLPSNQNVINLTSNKSLKSVIIEVFSFGSVLESSILSRNPPMELLRGRNLINKAGQLFLAEDVLEDNSLIVFFFSAGWCEGVQCNLVLYKLLQIKEESVKQSLQLQIIFVSSDTDSYSFDNYFRYHGDWYAVPFEDELAEILRWNYGITHLPHVVVCKPEGVIVTKKGRQEIIEKGLNVLVTWSEHKNT